MKRCPRCGQTYTDQDINFCLNDGELLSRQTDSSYKPPFPESRPSFADDSPPTVVLDQARVTNPTSWSPPAGQVAQYQQQYQSPIFAAQAGVVTPNQVLGIISLATGASSLVLGWCCGLGLLLGPAGIITGIIALIQNKSDPARYGGRGFAIGGIATGSIFLVLYVLYFVLVVLLNVFS